MKKLLDMAGEGNLATTFSWYRWGSCAAIFDEFFYIIDTVGEFMKHLFCRLYGTEKA